MPGDLKVMWHIHPNVDVAHPNDPGATFKLGNSTPSDENGDITVAKSIPSDVWHTDQLVVGARDRIITYYDDKGERGSLSYDTFQDIGKEKKGKIYDTFNKAKDKNNSDSKP